MDSNYEIIRYKQGLSARIIVHSVNRFKFHWHKEIEILLVLKGSIFLYINGQKHTLHEDDIFLINSNEIHSSVANEENILVAVQINPELFQKTFPGLQDIYFKCHSCQSGGQKPEAFSQLRSFIAQMIVEYNKSGEGYQLAIEGTLNTMLAYIVRNMPRIQNNNARILFQDKDIPRIKHIMEYIDNHYSEKITLDDIARSEFLSVYYVSHFFKYLMLPITLLVLNLMVVFVLLFMVKRYVYDTLENSSISDPLTKVFNRRYFMEFLNHEIIRANRKNDIFCLVMLDIDRFKKINDTFGHDLGDHVLETVAAVAQKDIRKSDVFSRIGGEEFTLLLPDTSLDKALIMAERVRSNIESHAFKQIGKVTVSLGVAAFQHGDSADSIMKRADVALYHAKENGRNRIEAG